MLIQLMLTGVLVLGAWMTWRRFRQYVIRTPETLAWMGMWIGALVIVWRPGTSTFLAHLFGVGRGADLVVYVSISFLLLSVFQLHIAHERLERTITKLVRHEALKDLGEASANNCCHSSENRNSLIGVDSRFHGNDKEGNGNDKEGNGNDKEGNGNDKEGNGNDKEVSV